MREDEQGEGEEREREREREIQWKHEARVRGTGVREGEMIARNSSPGRCGVEGIIQTLRHYLFFFTCQKECVRATSVCMRERGACWSSERSEEEAEAPLIFSLCRAHRCLQTSGLTLITHIYRQGRGQGVERFDLRATENLQIPFYPSSPVLLFVLPHFCVLCSFSPPLLSPSVLPFIPSLTFFFLSLKLRHF